MTYQEWLQYTEDERTHLKSLEEKCRSESPDLLLEMSRLSLSTAIKYSESSQPLAEYIASKKFVFFWKTQLSALKDTPYATVTPPMTPYLQVKGYYFLQKGFIQQAAENYCYSALKFTISRIFRDATDTNEYYSAASYSILAAKYHGFPGFVLHFETCLRIANLTDDSIFLKQALTALLVAKTLSTSSTANTQSQAAFRQQPLNQVLFFKFTSWEQAISDVSTQLPSPLRDAAYEEAKSVISSMTEPSIP